MSLPTHLKSQLINAMINYKAASDTLETVAPSFGEWAGYMTQNPNVPGYIVKSYIPIPPEKLPLVQNAWDTFDRFNQLIKQAQDMGYDYAIYIMPLANHYIDGKQLTV